MIKIEKLSHQDEEKWDSYVMRHQKATLYHLLGWRDVIKKSYGHQDCYLVAKDRDNIRGIFPAFLINRLGGKELISLPFCNYGGAISDNALIDNKFLEYIKQLCSFEKLSVQIRSRYSQYKHPFSAQYVTSILNLKPGPDLLWRAIDKKVRNQVRKAERSNLILTSGKKNLPEFYRVYCGTMKRLGTPNHSLSFFREILDKFPSETNIFIVNHDRRPIAGMFSFIFKDTFSDPWAASDDRYLSLCPNDFIYWKTIIWACERKLSYFDLGRSTTESSVHFFKKRWGTETSSLYYYELPYPRSLDSSSKKRLFTRIWSLLPTITTTHLGPHLRRYIP